MLDITPRHEQIAQQRSLGISTSDQFAGYRQDVHPDAHASKGSLLGDLLMAPFRGAEGLLQGVYGLADTALGDALPDYEDRLLGTSTTGLGGFLEGTSQFMLGFVPVLGWVGRGAQVGKTGFSLAKGLSTTAQKAAKATGKKGLGGLSPLSQATHIELRRAGVSGAIVDFAGFEGTEARLSNLIQESDLLRNEVSAFLAADEEDSELLGRLKNVFEGYILGMVADGVIEGGKAAYRAFASKQADELARGVKATKEMRKAQERGADEEEILDIGWSYLRTEAEDQFDESFGISQQDRHTYTRRARGAVGAPPGATSPSGIRGLRSLMQQAAEAGAPAADWYEKSSVAIKDLAKGDMEEAERLASVFALASPSGDSATATHRALRAFAEYKRGMTREDFVEQGTGHMYKALRESMAKVLYDGMSIHEATSGPKVRNFYRNLMVEIDPSRGQGTTNDLWMARAFGFASDSLTPAQHRFITRELKRVGDKMGMSPHQAQAAIWTTVRKLSDNHLSDIEEAARKAGIQDRSIDGKAGTGEFRAFYGRQLRRLMRRRLNDGDLNIRAEDGDSYGDVIEQSAFHYDGQAQLPASADPRVAGAGKEDAFDFEGDLPKTKPARVKRYEEAIATVKPGGRVTLPFDGTPKALKEIEEMFDIVGVQDGKIVARTKGDPLAAIHDSDMGTRAEFAQSLEESLLDDEGRDIIADLVGAQPLTPGRFPVGSTADGVPKGAALDDARVYYMARAYALGQTEAFAVRLQHTKGKAKLADQNAFVLEVPQGIGTNEVNLLTGKLRELFKGSTRTVVEGDKFIIANIGKDNPAFQKKAKQLTELFEQADGKGQRAAIIREGVRDPRNFAGRIRKLRGADFVRELDERVASRVEDVKNGWRARLTGDNSYLPQKSGTVFSAPGSVAVDAEGQRLYRNLQPLRVEDDGLIEVYAVVDGELYRKGAAIGGTRIVTDFRDINHIAGDGSHVVKVRVHPDEIVTSLTTYGNKGELRTTLPSMPADVTLDQLNQGLARATAGERNEGLGALFEIISSMDLPRATREDMLTAVKSFDEALTKGMGQSPFENVRFLGLDEEADRIAGAHNFAANTILIAPRIAGKQPKHALRTIFHEMWHHLEGFLTKSEIEKIKMHYGAEKGRVLDFQRLEGGGKMPEGYRKSRYLYRYSDVTEWFAEVMADRTLDWHLGRALGNYEAGSKIAEFLEMLSDFVVDIYRKLSKFGGDPGFSKELFEGFTKEGTPREFHRNASIERPLWAFQKTDTVFSRAVDPEPVPVAKALMKNLVGEEEADKILKNIEERSAEGLPAGVNPRAKDADGEYLYTKQDLLRMQLERSDLNLSMFDGDNDALGTIRAVENLFREYGPSKVSFGEQEEQALGELADMLGGDNPTRTKAELLKDLGRDVDRARELNARVLARRMLLLKHSKRVKSLAEKAAKPGAGRADLLEFREAVDYHAKLTLGVKALAAEQGRGLGANRIPVRDIATDPRVLEQEISEGLSKAGGEKKVRKLAEEVAAVLGDDIDGAAVGSLSRMAKGAQTRPSMLLEYWINSILSGPQTQLVNIIANTLTTIYLPLEKMLGGAATLNLDVVAQGWRELLMLPNAFIEALQFSRASFKGGTSILSPDLGKLDDPRMGTEAITGDRAAQAFPSLEGREDLKGMIDVTGKLVRLPTRALTAADELFKQWNFRAKLYSNLHQKAAQQGLRGEQAARFVRQEMDKFFYQGQAYSSASEYRRGLEDAQATGVPEEGRHAHAKQFAQDRLDPERLAVAEEAMFRAEEATFTKPLRQGSISRKIQDAVSAHPMLRLVMPFVRTPVNIATFAGQRMDISSLGPMVRSVLQKKPFSADAPALRNAQQRFIRDIYSGDPVRRAEAAGRMAMGFGMTFTMLQMAMSGQITGRGPADPELRQIMQDGGWQPYSILVGGKYISYQRLDPLASLLGVPADLIGYSQWSTQVDQTALEEMTFGLVYAFSSNFVSKTYLTGVRNLVEMVFEPERRVRPEMQRLGASFLPYSSFLNQLAQADDSTLREVHTMGEALRAKIPGMSDDLEPVRNILGEPVSRSGRLGMDTLGSAALFFSPIAVSEVSSDTLHQEFVKLGHPFNPPYPSQEGVDLREVRNATGRRAYDRWQELHGEVKINGMSLRQALRKVVRDPSYQRLNPESTPEFDSPRIQILRRVMGRYRRAAYRTMLQEYPELIQTRADNIQKRRDTLFQ